MIIDPRAAKALAVTAAANGGQQIRPTETYWDISRSCERPIRQEVDGRAYRGTRVVGREYVLLQPERGALAYPMRGITPHIVYLDVACGRCRSCLAYRRWLWTVRAMSECEAAPRTWFVTLTGNPRTQMRWAVETGLRLTGQGVKPSELTDGEWYAEMCKEAGRDLTKYVKRVRKNSGASLRALWVFEKHEGGGRHDGLPHIHGLVHETNVNAPVRYATLRETWSARPHGLGHSSAALLTKGDESLLSRYVAKACYYISKSAGVRIRASQGYGSCQAQKQP